MRNEFYPLVVTNSNEYEAVLDFLMDGFERKMSEPTAVIHTDETYIVTTSPANSNYEMN